MGRVTSVRSLLADLPDLARWGRIVGDPDVPVRSIAYDSRLVAPGDLFVALRGFATDGHRYLPQALDRGAIAALTEAPVADPRLRCNVVVDDTRAALAQIAAAFYGEPSRRLGLIGVTGTKGKTTTTFLIESLLARAGRRTGLIGTVDIKIGPDRWSNPVHQTTPESIEVQRYLRAMVDADVEWAVLETSSHGLGMHRVDRCAYDVAVLTNVTHEHLDFHGTYEHYLAAKARLFDHLVEEGGKTPARPRWAILNADDPGAASLLARPKRAPQLTYGLAAGCDVRATEVELSPTGISFTLRSPWGERAVRLPLLGQFNVSNALAAATTTLAVGLPPDAVVEGLARFEGVPGRLQRVEAGQPFLVIVDFAHNADSLAQVLRLLRPLAPGRLIALFGSAGRGDVAKRAMMGRVCAELADFGIFADEDPRTEDPAAILAGIAAGAAAAGWVEGRDYERIADRRAAIERACALARPGDAVLLAGKGHENTIAYADREIPWDEAAEARAALAHLGYDA